MNDLSDINLNLLKILDALLTESHVTGAGKRLGLSQSATSTALGQLRELLQDPILVRGQGGQMQLTDYAKSLQSRVSRLVQELTRVFNRQSFDAAQATRVFHVGMSDYLSFVLLPGLIQKLQAVAPQVKLVIHHVNYFNDGKQLERGELDLVLGSFPNIPQHLASQELYQDQGVFVANRQHPLAKRKSLLLKDITQYPLIMVSYMNDPTDNYLDRLLKSHELNARVSVVVPHALIALQSLHHSQFITHTVKRIAKPLADQLGLCFLKNPSDLKKETQDPYTAKQYWYKTTSDDPGHSWLRGVIKQVALQKN